MITQTRLLEDTRPIHALWYEPQGNYTVGQFGVTEILVYGETRGEGYDPWFAVYESGRLARRLNAAMVAGVCYEETGKEKP